MQKKKIPGQNKGSVMLYALSTCIWCKKTKKLLSELGVEYEYVDVDLLEGEERAEAVNEVRKVNPKCSYPTLVVNSTCIMGYKETEIRELLK